MRPFAPLLALALLTTTTACEEPPNSLSGSIEQNFDLSFDTTRFRFINQTSYQLEYLLTFENGDENVICKIVFNDPGGLSTEAEVDIVANEGLVERIAGDGQFDALDSGVVRFLNIEGDLHDGEFAITFADGKTLNGTFEVTLEEANL